MTDDKMKKLTEIISQYERLAIALSGGVDSVFLLKAASLVMPRRNILAVTARGPFFPQREAQEASEAAAGLAVPHLRLDFNPLAVAEVASNPADRCYHCKKALFTLMRQETAQRGFRELADGSNLDDLNDYRPGAKAVEELGIISPLKLAALGKNDIRRLSAELGLSTWDKPAFACLASRIPYGRPIEAADLERIEMAEDYLLGLGLHQIRVRVHEQLARIEVDAKERNLFFDLNFMDKVNRRLKDLGFRQVTLDLGGYQPGGLNAEVAEKERRKYRQN